MEWLTNVGKRCHVTTLQILNNMQDAGVNFSRGLAQARAVNYSCPTTTICFVFQFF